MKKTLFKAVAASAALLFCICAISCGKKNDKGMGAEAEALFAVNTFKTSEGNLDNYLEFSGDVSAVSSVDVMPDMAGKISRVLVSVGDLVKKDQIIAYVDASRAGMTYSASPVKASISGRVTSFPYTVGTSVSQSMAVAKIADTDELQIKVNIPERFISRIKEKQTAVVTFDAYPGVEFNARVFEVSPVLDSVSRTMAIKLKFTNPDSRIRAGMFARVKLITDIMNNVIVVPSNAIITREEKPYMFVIASPATEKEAATVKMVAVTPGITVDAKTEIQQGLFAGDEVVVKGQSLLKDGAKVSIVSTTGTDKE